MQHEFQESDNRVCFHSLRPRAVGFETELPSSELGPQRNFGDVTRTNITQKDFRGGGLIATISRVCYGTFQQKKATIIVIRLLLHAPKEAYKFRHLEVEVSFEPRSNSLRAHDGSNRYPVVRNLSPYKVYGTPNVDGQTWFYRVEQQSLIRSGSPDVSSAAEKNATRNVDTSPSLTIAEKPWSDRRRRDMHKACWIVKERGEPPFGIPDEKNLAVAVECEYAFQATVKVVLDIPLSRKFLALPWSEDDPILFPSREPGHFIGEGLRTAQFETLTDVEWANLISGYEVIKTSHTTTLGALAKSLFGFNYEEYDIEVRSLVLDVERHDLKVATIESAQLDRSRSKSNQQQQEIYPLLTHGTVPIGGQRHVIVDTHFHNFTPLAEPKDGQQHVFDVIALSGLGGHGFGSFKERTGSHIWLRDDLPRDFPHARILIYGYDTKLEDSRSFQDLEALASTLRTALKIVRRPRATGRELNDKPILFIAHSLGGIVLKQVLIQMADGDERDKVLSQSVKGILFFGVPSQGMEISSLLPMVRGRVNEPFLHGLRHDSDNLRDQHREFCAKFPYKSCRIVSFYETEYSPTARKGPSGWKMDGEPTLLVGPSSATLGSRMWEIGPNYSHPIKRDHSSMVKFHPDDHWYSVVRHVLEDLSQGMRPM